MTNVNVVNQQTNQQTGQKQYVPAIGDIKISDCIR